MSTLVVDRWLIDRDIMIAKAKEAGAEIILKNANESAEEQKKQIQDLIKEKVDVIIIVAYDKYSLSGVISSARRKKIKVIAYDRMIMNTEIDLHISFDNRMIGRKMAEAVSGGVEKGNVVIVNGAETDNNSYEYNKGVYEVLDPRIKSGEINVVKEVWAENWRESDAYESIHYVIENGIGIDAVIAANDRLADGVIKALAEYKLSGIVPVVGHDAELAACQRIVEETQYATIFKPIDEMAVQAISSAIKMAKDEKIENLGLINNGLHEVPLLFINDGIETVTKGNIDEIIIKSGFYTRNEVYLNMK